MTWASLFRGTRNTSEIWTGKIARRMGTRPSALQNSFVFKLAAKQTDREIARQVDRWIDRKIDRSIDRSID